MDLGKILEATETITFEFLGETSTVEVYTAGVSRLTAAQAKAFREGDDIAAVQSGVPVIVKSWDLTWNGEPLTLEMLKERGPDDHFLYPMPLAFINALWSAAEGVMYGRPTEASESPAGLQPEADATLTAAIQ